MRKQLQGLVVITIGLLICGFSHGATYGGGSGAAADPYQIWTPEQMNTIGLNPADWGLHFKLMADIDMAAIAYNVIGSATTPFTGSFNGNGFSIVNLFFPPSSDGKELGVFGYTDSSLIQNLIVKNVYFIYNLSDLGGIAGRNGGTISNCKVLLDSANVTGPDEPQIRGSNRIGGIVGLNYGSVENCVASISVVGDANIGGIVGWNQRNASVSNCMSYSFVSGGGQCAGIVGSNGGLVANCVSTGDVNGGTAGGVVGYDSGGTITGCFASGDVFSPSPANSAYLGGLVGYSNSATISNCYATGSVSEAGRYLGGLIGFSIGTAVSYCYAAGSVDISRQCVGGLFGLCDGGSVTGCVWDVQASGTLDGAGNIDPDPAGVNGWVTAMIMSSSNLMGIGWDISTRDDPPAVWMMLREGEDYPRLAWQTVYEGDIAGLYGVDIVDFLEIAENWLETGCPTGCEQADIDSSGKVDLADFAVVASQWLK